jgi:AraC-like DNA-binding protein
MFVIPRPILARARRHPLVRSVYPTDIGWFPTAAHHYRNRPHGAGQDHLMMCVGGHGYASIDGREAHLHAGELLVIPRETRHTYWAADDEPWSIYWVHFLGDEADYFVDRIPRRGKPVPILPEAQAEAVRLFRYCLNALYDGYGQATLIYAAQSVQHILSLLLFQNHSLPTEQRKKNWRTDLQSIFEFMHANLDQPLRLEDFAAAADLSVSHFSELFRSQTGQSPMAYFIELRMRLACRLLDLSDKPVKVVAIEAGYRDPYYFSRVFKKAMGLSPEKYRAIKKG